MPGPETEQGKRLFRIFENCTHRAENGLADEWCGCYVRALFDSKVSDPILALLENNPFADARTYMEAVIKSISSGAKLYECAQEGGRNLDTYRFSQPEKVTACLQSEKPCLYRSHWADFTISGGSCNPTLTSKSHGGPAMSCEAVSKQLQK
jgi:hypothetical protein